jgi:hypothetical protein
MNCTNMLTLLLEAEPEELEGKGSSVVAVHLRECARCRAVAAKLHAETALIAVHVGNSEAHARTTRRAASGPLIWTGALAAAGIVALVLTPHADVHVRGDAHAAPPAAQTAVVEPRPAGRPSPAPIVRPPSARLNRAGTAIPVTAVRFAEVASATPVRFAASQSSEAPMPPGESSGVSVVPPAGKSAAVLATRNSKITVVWLY